MNKPKVTLHITSTLDGKISGNWGKSPQVKAASDLFKKIGFDDESNLSMHFDGWVYGKNTSTEGFGNKLIHDLSDNLSLPSGDYIINKNQKRYYIAIDRKGEIGWTKNTAEYGGQEASVIEILTDRASSGFKQYLRDHQIPYLIAGQENVDFNLMLHKLHDIYGLNNLMLGGGGILNWSFLEAGLIDEISIVFAPVVNGATKAATVFNSIFDQNTHAIALKPIKILTYPEGTIWVRYKAER